MLTGGVYNRKFVLFVMKPSLIGLSLHSRKLMLLIKPEAVDRNQQQRMNSTERVCLFPSKRPPTHFAVNENVDHLSVSTVL